MTDHETLKQRYSRATAPRRATLQERHAVLLEAQREKLILEKFDRNTLKAVTNLITRLKGIDFGGLTSLEQARNAAVKDATRALAGSGTGSLIDRVKQLFGKGNPLGDPLSFAASMNDMFTDMKEYLTALGAKPGDDRSVQELVASGDNEEENKKLLTKIISTGIKPTKGSSNWVRRYLPKNLKSVTQEIALMKAGDLLKVADTAAGATQNAKAAQQAAAGAGEAATKGTEPTSGTSPTSSTASTGETQETKPSKTTVGTGESPLDDDDEKSRKTRQRVVSTVKKTYEDIKSDFGDLDPKIVQQVLLVLAYNNKIK